MIKILIIVTFIILTIVLSTFLILHCIELKLLKKLDDIDIEIDAEGIIFIEDKRVRKILLKVIKKVITSLNIAYNTQNWDNKRFLYNIMSDISFLKNNLQTNTLTELDMEKISTIIEVIKIDKMYSSTYEKIIFEWEKNYISTK